MSTCDDHFTDVQVLLHFEGINGATTFHDSSQHGLTLTGGFYGQISTAQAKFGSSSYVATPGVGYAGYIQAAGAALPSGYQIVNGTDFTVEGWFLRNGIAGWAEGCTVFALCDSTHQYVELFVDNTTGFLNCQFLHADGTSLFSPIRLLAGAANICDNSWHHVAVGRTGITYSLYVDGVRVDTADDASAVGNGYGRFSVGGTLTDSGRFRGVDCYIDDVRFTNGFARYSGATYTVPTETFNDVQCSTQLLCDPDLLTRSVILHFDGTDGDTSFVDSSVNALVLAGHGSAALTSTTPKFGATSLACANSHYVSIPIDAAGPLDLSTGDFTIEGWFWQDTAANEIFLGLGTYSGNGFYIQTVASGQILSLTAQAPTNATADSNLGTYVTGAWNSFAIQRSGDTIAVACNGVFGTPQTFAGDLGLSGLLKLGGYAGSFLNGKLDDVRITKGAALYSSPYAPYTYAFPDTACGLPAGTVTVSGTFVPSSDGKAIEMDRLGTIKPRIYAPVPNRIARTRP